MRLLFIFILIIIYAAFIPLSIAADGDGRIDAVARDADLILRPDLNDETATIVDITTSFSSDSVNEELGILRRGDGVTDVQVTEHMDPDATARLICEGGSYYDQAATADDSCIDLAAQAIRLEQYYMHGASPEQWSYSEVCGSMMPRIESRKPALQYLHIPKAGTSVNWFLRDYFGSACASAFSSSSDRTAAVTEQQEEGNPCPEWLHTSELMERGLCGGRLFSCQGHRVREQLPLQVLARPNTYLLTFLRHPWERALSDFNHFLSHPESEHLSPHVRADEVVRGNFSSYLKHPGVPNCATKMLTGRQCGEAVDLLDADLDLAKRVLSKMLFFGITEHFRESLCLFSFMYGGSVEARHLRGYRKGNYSEQFYSRLGLQQQQQQQPQPSRSTLPSEEEVLVTAEAREAFRRAYRFDIALYDFAVELFRDRYKLTGCAWKED